MTQPRLPVKVWPESPWLGEDGGYDEVKAEAVRKEIRAMTKSDRVTNRNYWRLGNDTVRVDIINDMVGHHQRLVVNGIEGEFTEDNMLVSQCGKFVMFTPYWDGYVTTDVPMRMEVCKPD